MARFNENMFQSRESSPSPTRRSSIEKLQKASRVRNSNMFAREMKQEYDPTSVPLVERPLAKQLQGNAYGGAGIEGLRSAERPKGLGHHRNNSTTSFALYSPTQTPTKSYNKESLNLSSSPTKDQGSPTKSSLSSRFKSSLDSNESDDTVHDLPAGKGLHRHAKSVTFDAAPPQINEYEMATPDPSSVGTGSRENSYDSFEDDEEGYGYEHDSYDIDDSFDASLEDTDKTPVMGPDDWRHDSASDHSQMTEGPEGSPMPDARPSSVGRAAARTDSLNSTGSHRPLPPLPGNVEATRVGSSSSVIWTAPTAQRRLPLPPSPDVVTRTEHPEKGGATMTLEERLKLMMIDDKPRSAAEQQRERRLRRAGVRNSQTPERDTGAALTDEEDTIDDLPGIETYKLPPRISRESILRKVNSQSTTDTDDVFSSPMPSPSNDRVLHVDPDTPLPTTELQEPADDSADDDSVVIKPEHGEDDDVDVYDIPEMYRRSESRMDLYEDAETGAVESVDSESQYSEPLPRDASQPEHLDAAEVGNDGTPEAKTPMAYAVEPPADHKSLGLPEFSAFELNNDFGQSLQTYMSPSSPQEVEVPVTSTFASSRDQQPRTSISSQGRLGSISQAQELLRRSDTPEDEDTDSAATSTESLGNSQLGHKRMSMTDAQEYLRRPHTPEERVIPAMPEYDGAGWGPEDDESDPYEVSTPESVIHHSTASSVSPPPVEPSFIPEREATIKASGSKLRTRASATPADIAAMRDIRRQVSVGAPEVPEVPPVPERHRNRPSLNLTDAQGVDELQAAIERHDSFKKKSLTLDIGSDLGLSLDKDFDRVIEAQKVSFGMTVPAIAFLKFANISQRGYLMRQNTKLVVASSHDRDEDSRATRSCGNSPAKRERPSTWTVEPWNGQIRKPSNQIRSPRKKTTESAAPPLPGQQSNVAEVHMPEDTAAVSEDAGERGRLFVKVIGVKDLDLPLPRRKCDNLVYEVLLTGV